MQQTDVELGRVYGEGYDGVWVGKTVGALDGESVGCGVGKDLVAMTKMVMMVMMVMVMVMMVMVIEDNEFVAQWGFFRT